MFGLGKGERKEGEEKEGKGKGGKIDLFSFQIFRMLERFILFKM